MTALLRKAPDSNAPIAQECFKLLATLLRSCSSYQVYPLRFCMPIDSTKFKSVPLSLPESWAEEHKCNDPVPHILKILCMCNQQA